MGLGHWWILLIIALVALVIFGPRRLPELGEGLGKAIREFRKATTEVSQSIQDEVRQTQASATGTTYTGTATPSAPPSDPGAQPTPPPEAPKV